MHRHQNLVILISIGFVTLLILGNLFLIFHFSSESRHESGARSEKVTQAVAPIITPGYHEMTPSEQNTVVRHLHHYVRKAAHFLEFASLGCLSACWVTLLGVLLGRRRRVWQTMSIPAVFCLLTAVSDEVYQTFTNRGAAAFDVLIDFSGAVCGVIFLHAAVWLIACVSAAFRRRSGRKEASHP